MDMNYGGGVEMLDGGGVQGRGGIKGEKAIGTTIIA